MVRREQLQRLARVRRRLHVIAQARQKASQRLRDAILIVHHQHARAITAGGGGHFGRCHGRQRCRRYLGASMSTSRTNLAAVPGITVGHTTIEAHGTGCTVVLAPETGMRASVCVRGRATGTRELDVMDPRHLVERIDAILFTGGSALRPGAAGGGQRRVRGKGGGGGGGGKGGDSLVSSARLLAF